MVLQTAEVFAPNRHSTGRLVVVDDDPEIRGLLVRLLEAEGYQVRDASTGQEALDLLATRPPDLILLDVMLDTEDGFAILAQIRRVSDLPVILVTARAQESDRVFGLKLGADDYVVKPFSSAELAARIESVLRRVRSRRPAHMSSLVFDELEIDPDAREVRVLGRKIDLTAKEFELLLFLARSPRKVFSRGQFLAQVWDSSSEWQDANTVTEHVEAIRRKIEPRPGSAQMDRDCPGCRLQVRSLNPERLAGCAGARDRERQGKGGARTPGALSTFTLPFDWVTVAWTMASPRPVPLAFPFVVKNGSKQCSAVFGSIPVPVSDTEIANEHRRPVWSGTSRVSMRSRPPLGMASRALKARLSMARSSSALSTSTSGGELAKSAVISRTTGIRAICVDRRSSESITSEGSVSTSCRLLLWPICSNWPVKCCGPLADPVDRFYLGAKRVVGARCAS